MNMPGKLTRILLAGACVLFLGALGPWSAAAQKPGGKVYVKVSGAKLRGGAEATAPVVAELARGAELAVVAVEGTRVKASYQGKQGYISRLHVSETRPEEGGGGTLGGMARSDVSADERQTVASLRGLNPAAKAMAEREGVRAECVKWVDRMEQQSARITQPEVQNFLQGGGVGL